MIRNRVMLSLSLLFGAKVMNVTVPFFFKYAVDEVNNLTTTPTGDALLGMATVPQALGTTAFSLLVGCEYSIILLQSNESCNLNNSFKVKCEIF